MLVSVCLGHNIVAKMSVSGNNEYPGSLSEEESRGVFTNGERKLKRSDRGIQDEGLS